MLFQKQNSERSKNSVWKWYWRWNEKSTYLLSRVHFSRPKIWFLCMVRHIEEFSGIAAEDPMILLYVCNRCLSEQRPSL